MISRRIFFSFSGGRVRVFVAEGICKLRARHDASHSPIIEHAYLISFRLEHRFIVLSSTGR
jgi:hypothetical protein